MTDQVHAFRGMIGPSERAGVRHEVFEGRDHLVVPVVMIVEGVLPGSAGARMIPASEFAKFPAAWDGRPVPVLHPEHNGMPISANSPDVIEKNSIGQLFNTYVVDGRLKSEAWINVEKARRLGHVQLLDALEAGEIIEVSTGFFSEDEMTPGEFNGNAYDGVCRNLVPDHLALLPGEIGACSVADGCGTRVNSRSKTMSDKMRDAFETMARGLGFRANCECKDGGDMTAKLDALKAHLKTNKVSDEHVAKLTANEKLTPEQIEMLMSMDGEQLRMATAVADAMQGAAKEPEESEEMPAEMAKDEEDMPMPTGMSSGKVDPKAFRQLIANEVKEGMRRERVLDKLTANSGCAFSESQLGTMDTEALETYEKSIRPADYSGQGGFATNAGVTEGVEPLTMTPGVLAKKEAK